MTKEEFIKEFAKRIGVSIQEAEFKIELYTQQQGPITNYERAEVNLFIEGKIYQYSLESDEADWIYRQWNEHDELIEFNAKPNVYVSFPREKINGLVFILDGGDSDGTTQNV